MDWAGTWQTIKNFFTDNVWKIVGFFGALIIGIIVVKLLLNMTKKIMGKTKMEKVAQSFLYAVIKFCLYLVLILVLLSIIGVSLSGVLTAISALLLAVGMALQSNIANLANGIIIVSSHMFKKGDYIIVNGVEGSIEEINFLFTTIMTTDNKKITIPNSTIINNSVVNSGANKTRRIDFTFGVAYESDVEQVKKIVIDVMMSDGRVLLDPPPFCRLKYLQESSIDFFANCWVDKEDYWDVYYYVIENVYNEFKRHGISIPYNQIEVRERKDKVVLPYNKEELPKRVEKERKESKRWVDLENDDLTAIFKKKKKDGAPNKSKEKNARNKRKDKNDKNKNEQLILNQESAEEANEKVDNLPLSSVANKKDGNE